jgi:hypothetical protein
MRLAAAVLFSVFAVAASTASSASAAGIEGTVYDVTCGAGCAPTCPPPPTCRRDEIACPLRPADRPLIVCPQAETTPPLYSGDAGRAIVRRTGTKRVVAHKTVREGGFRFHLAPGSYRVTVKVAAPCWRGQTVVATVVAGGFTPVSTRVRDECVMHPDR